MLEITCKGTPYEVCFDISNTFFTFPDENNQILTTKPKQIGYQHGSQAASQIKGSISFYTSLFQQNVKISWPEVQKTALEFEPVIRENWPEYLEEMRGKRSPKNVEVDPER